jgi:carbonic anhydrase
MVNVARQVEVLTRHPLVADAHRRGELEVIGMFYDIGSAVPLRIEPSSIDSFVATANSN